MNTQWLDTIDTQQKDFLDKAQTLFTSDSIEDKKTLTIAVNSLAVTLGVVCGASSSSLPQLVDAVMRLTIGTVLEAGKKTLDFAAQEATTAAIEKAKA